MVPYLYLSLLAIELDGLRILLWFFPIRDIFASLLIIHIDHYILERHWFDWMRDRSSLILLWKDHLGITSPILEFNVLTLLGLPILLTSIIFFLVFSLFLEYFISDFILVAKNRPASSYDSFCTRVSRHHGSIGNWVWGSYTIVTRPHNPSQRGDFLFLSECVDILSVAKLLGGL